MVLHYLNLDERQFLDSLFVNVEISFQNELK